ncbi:hypothetical protein [Ferrimonas balearica]|nr:hypothetical protein [Ferrimonas balearica]MBY5993624.1 hypothetical protein [Ferrimonas balearica]
MSETHSPKELAQSVPTTESNWRDSQLGQQLVDLLEEAYQDAGHDD